MKMEGTIEFGDNPLVFAFTKDIGWILRHLEDMDENLPDYVLDRADDPRVLIFTVTSAYLTAKDMATAKLFLDNFSAHHPGGRDFEIVLLCGKLLLPHTKLPKGITLINVTDFDDEEIGFKKLMLN
jgi:hypothetical protein